MERNRAPPGAPVRLRWLRLPWEPGYAARIYLVAGFLLAMVAVVIARLVTGGDVSDPLVNLVNHLFIGSASIVAGFTIGRPVALATALAAHGVAYVAVFPLLLAATRTELTIDAALQYQVDLAVIVFAWAAGAILLLAGKRALLAWVDRESPSDDGSNA